jgi:replication factor A1
MNMELMDKDGTLVQATFFGNDAIQKYGNLLKENKVYLFSNGQVRIANKKFTSIKNDYCLIFDQNADIAEAEEDNSIKKQGFSFVGLKGIQELVQQQAVDVIGIIVEVGQIGNVPLKTGQTKQRRNVHIGDESGLKIQIALWGNLASMFDL